MPYRSEIDGLRALAVVAVIIHHFSDAFLPSGYLGVDIFFVVSGFVITASLSHRSSGGFRDFLLDFYTRRIKRLVPALALFVAVSGLLICLFDPAPVASLRTGVAALFGLSNLYLLKQASDYFGSAVQLNAFTHTWSLGVEEQFYFAYPFLFWFIGRSRRETSGPRNLFLVMAVLSAASLAIFVYLAKVNQPAAYFLAPSRFWELGAGCLLALAAQRPGRLFRLAESMPPLPVVLGIAVALTAPLEFQVPATVAVVALTAVLIACLREGTAGHALLGSAPMVYIGKISYSLYLWHWAVICLSRWTVGIHWWSIPIQAALMLVLAVASYHYVEVPFRRATWSARRWKSIGFGIGGSAIAASLLVVLMSGGSGALYSGRAPQDDGGPEAAAGVSAHAGGTEPGGTVLLVGDSHALHFSSMVEREAKRRGMDYAIVSAGATAFPTVNVSSPAGGLTLAKNRAANGRMLEQLDQALRSREANRPSLIVLSSFYRFYFDTPSGSRKFQVVSHFDADGNPLTREAAFRKWLQDLGTFAAENMDSTIVVILSTPEMPGIYPLPLCREEWFRPSLSERCSVSVSRAAVVAGLDALNSRIVEQAKQSGNIVVFDPTPALCPVGQEYCRSGMGGHRLYRDEDHLTELGSSLVGPAFGSLLDRTRAIPR